MIQIGCSPFLTCLSIRLPDNHAVVISSNVHDGLEGHENPRETSCFDDSGPKDPIATISPVRLDNFFYFFILTREYPSRSRCEFINSSQKPSSRFLPMTSHERRVSA